MWPDGWGASRHHPTKGERYRTSSAPANNSARGASRRPRAQRGAGARPNRDVGHGGGRELTSRPRSPRCRGRRGRARTRGTRPRTSHSAQTASCGSIDSPRAGCHQLGSCPLHAALVRHRWPARGWSRSGRQRGGDCVSVDSSNDDDVATCPDLLYRWLDTSPREGLKHERLRIDAFPVTHGRVALRSCEAMFW
jgi:hypothetical protein